VKAADVLMDSIINRNLVLAPGLKDAGVGHALNLPRGWIWVINLTPSVRPDQPPVLYPLPDQKDVPLWYPVSEWPNPVPEEGRGKEAGYAVTALFPPGTVVTGATARLADGAGREVDCWPLTPDRSPIPGGSFPVLGLVPKAPLKGGTAYTVSMTARARGAEWKKTWTFTTMREPEAAQEEMATRVVAALNAFRVKAGLNPVTLDDRLSGPCRLHARYLARNARHPSVQGLGMHNEDPALPGSTPEGARVGKKGTIASVSEPLLVVDGWVGTFYHRIPLLAPDLKRVGFGCYHERLGENWFCVLDAKDGK
jgi:hypothetical protein